MPENVQGVSQFISSLHKGQYDDAEGHGVLHLGQGISAYDERFIREELAHRNLSGRWLIQGRGGLKASRSQVHKHREKNVLIADLEPLGQNRFRSRLVVDDDSELLLDHATGWHVSGMVILEAMRQMGMAVTERFCDLSTLGGQRGFIIQNWNTSFANFLFPLAAHIICTVEPVSSARAKRLEFRADLRVMQCERCAAQASIEFAVLEQDSLNSIEERFARAAVKQVVQALPAPAPAGRRVPA
jgi:hypothetical protein